MMGSMAFRGTGSISPRVARVEQLPISPFISGAYSLFYGIETKRSDPTKWRSVV